jgi:hypothetical protein
MDEGVYGRPTSLAGAHNWLALLDDAPAMYRTFRDKHDACIKVVMKLGLHRKPTSSLQCHGAIGN